MKILDCTLRDGGYYTNWDFHPKLVETYMHAFNTLPVEYLEVGYRSKPLDGYLGEYFYCPPHVLANLRETSNKKLVIILNEKDIRPEDAPSVLSPCKGLIDMVRLAIDPKNFGRALKLAEAVKQMGFEVGFNVMYMSTWASQQDFLNQIPFVEGIADYFYMVDSYGGVYPEDVKSTYELVKSKANVKIGFHGHNNLELALINTLTAISCGADMVDATVTGMGRGAGNLKTELLLTALHAQGKVELDFNALSKAVDGFMDLQREYEWGTNLPYMVSGAHSLPQKDVMEWVSKRFYSFNSIIRALSNQSKGLEDNLSLESFRPKHQAERVVIVGGGPSPELHAKAIREYLLKHPDTALVFASSKNVKVFQDLPNRQYHCLAGNEGYRLESYFSDIPIAQFHQAVLPPYPRTMGTYIPAAFSDKSFQLDAIAALDGHHTSVTVLSIETAIRLGAKHIYFVGYDGYRGNITGHELELFNENEVIFSQLSQHELAFAAITPTQYTMLPHRSIYSML